MAQGPSSADHWPRTFFPQIPAWSLFKGYLLRKPFLATLSSTRHHSLPLSLSGFLHNIYHFWICLLIHKLSASPPGMPRELLFCLLLALSRCSVTICWVNERAAAPPSALSPSLAGVSDFRTTECSEVSPVTRPPPCPKGGRPLKHPVPISGVVLFLSLFFKNLQRNQTVKCSLVAIPGHCSVPPLRRSRKPTAFSLRLCQPPRNIPQRALRETREKKQLRSDGSPSIHQKPTSRLFRRRS